MKKDIGKEVKCKSEWRHSDLGPGLGLTNTLQYCFDPVIFNRFKLFQMVKSTIQSVAAGDSVTVKDSSGFHTGKIVMARKACSSPSMSWIC